MHAVAAQGDPGGQAKETIAAMADQDPVLRYEAAETYVRLYGKAPSSRPAPKPPSTTASGDPMRVILAPTAFTRPQGTSSFNAFELGTLTFDHGITPNIALGLHTAIPIGAFVFGPTLRCAGGPGRLQSRGRSPASKAYGCRSHDVRSSPLLVGQ